LPSETELEAGFEGAAADGIDVVSQRVDGVVLVEEVEGADLDLDVAAGETVAGVNVGEPEVAAVFAEAIGVLPPVAEFSAREEAAGKVIVGEEGELVEQGVLGEFAGGSGDRGSKAGQLISEISAGLGELVAGADGPVFAN